MANVGKITVNLVAKTAQFSSGLNTARGKLASFASGIGSMAASAIKFGAAAGVAATAGLAYFGKSAAQRIDEMGKFSDVVGFSTEALGGLNHAANLAGVEQSTLNRALIYMNRNLANAGMGMASANMGFRMLGLNAAELRNMRPEEQFYSIADAISRVQDPTARIGAAMQIFGRGGAGMINMLKNGSGELKDMQAEAERLGLTFSRLDAANVERANDALDRMKSAFGGLINKLVITFAPTISVIFEHITNNWDKVINNLMFGLSIIGKAARLILNIVGAFAGTIQYVVAKATRNLSKALDIFGIDKTASRLKAFADEMDLTFKVMAAKPFGTRVFDMLKKFHENARLEAGKTAKYTGDMMLDQIDQISNKGKETAEKMQEGQFESINLGRYVVNGITSMRNQEQRVTDPRMLAVAKEQTDWLRRIASAGGLRIATAS